MDMLTLAEQARIAVGDRDHARLAGIGDQNVDICESCHSKYKPGPPKMGIKRFPAYPTPDCTKKRTASTAQCFYAATSSTLA